MATDLTVILRDTPGELARLGEVTGTAGVNIRGLAGSPARAAASSTCSSTTTSSRAHARSWSARASGSPTSARCGWSTSSIGRAASARELSEANVNIDLAYTTFGGVKLVVATDDLENARAALE